MRTIIHVAQDAIRRNMKNGTNDPAIIVRRGSTPERHSEVELRLGGVLVGTFKYQPHAPLPCGARVWLELAEGVTAEPPKVPEPCPLKICSECGSGDYGLCRISNRVYCRECGFRMPVNYTGTLQDSIDAWNKRSETAHGL